MALVGIKLESLVSEPEAPTTRPPHNFVRIQVRLKVTWEKKEQLLIK